MNKRNKIEKKKDKFFKYFIFHNFYFTITKKI